MGETGMRSIRHLGALVFGALLLVSAGCATYQEPAPSAASAILKGKEGCIIDGVDGITTGGGLSKMSVGGIAGSMGGNEVRVTPGMHSVSVTHTTGNGEWVHNFRLECVANHKYSVEPKSLYGGTVVIRDVTTGQILDLTPVAQAPVAAPSTMPVASTPVAPAPAAVSPAVASAAPVVTPVVPVVSAPAPSIPEAPVAPAMSVKVAAPRVSHRTTGILLTVPVTLDNVENVPFTLHAYLCGTDGKPLADSAGRIEASREVKTGDDSDTDDYKLTIPAARMTSLHIGMTVLIRVELLDPTGRVVSQAPVAQTMLGNT
jgi:hypothetical protein